MKLVRTNLPVVTLAIGDGANDVAMIQEAHIGMSERNVTTPSTFIPTISTINITGKVIFIVEIVGRDVDYNLSLSFSFRIHCIPY